MKKQMVLVLGLSILTTLTTVGCNKNDAGTPAEQSLAAPATDGTKAPDGTQPAAEAQKTTAEEKDFSKTATAEGVSIKHMHLGASTMDVLNPNPRGTSSHQPGALILGVCVPRLTDDTVKLVADIAYPIGITGHSQVALRRDTNYRFGDGSSAHNSPPVALLTCAGEDKGGALTPLEGPSVQVKQLRVGQSTMETLNPNPKGANGNQEGMLILVACAPRITDEILPVTKEIGYPIVVSQGSQVILRRSTNYRFGDGSSSASLAPVVVIDCVK